MKKPVILFGGTFNPPHKGHLLVAEAALNLMGADCLYWVVAGEPAHKKLGISTEHRVNMVNIMVDSNPKFKLGDWELHRNGPSYTVDTLKQVRLELELDPDPSALIWIMGSDSMATIGSWEGSEEFVDLANFLVISRDGFGENEIRPILEKTLPNLLGNIKFLDLIGNSDASSTSIRENIDNDKVLSFLSENLYNYIKENKLYVV